MLRPLWAKVGYKGAAFNTRNHAHGGHLNSGDEGWMVPQMVGEDVDIVMWESVMNDAGRVTWERTEMHVRGGLGAAKRPLYHALVAGNCFPGGVGRPRVGGFWNQLREVYKDIGFRSSSRVTPQRKRRPIWGRTRIVRGAFFGSPGIQGHRAIGSTQEP